MRRCPLEIQPLHKPYKNGISSRDTSTTHQTKRLNLAPETWFLSGHNLLIKEVDFILYKIESVLLPLP